MTGGEALQEFERRLVGIQGMAAATDSWYDYRNDKPASMDGRNELAMLQGFEAGYAAAMQNVRTALTKTQNTALANA